MDESLKIVVVGGGAAGFFGAITCAENFPHHQILLFEKTRQLLSKVRISGGGRCNVTHACFDPLLLIKNYPRGNRELQGPFNRFQPSDTIQWFKKRGVILKTEEDGRMFPITDSSETIANCLLQEAQKLGIRVCLEHSIHDIRRHSQGFLLELSNGQSIQCDRLLLATGSAPKIYPILERLGHSNVPLVPSLFTFNTPQSPFLDLAGITVQSASIKLPEWGRAQNGPLLITHWGLSGPAVLKLSAWTARELASVDYQTQIVVNWLPSFTEKELREELQTTKQKCGARQVISDAPVALPKQLWKRLVTLAGISEELRWAALSHQQLHSLMIWLQSTSLQLQGKTTYKQEFVTCGGVPLEEVNFKTLESRICPGLYFAGEILNIDGVTGGFNFQNAWTTGWIAGQAIGLP